MRILRYTLIGLVFILAVIGIGGYVLVNNLITSPLPTIDGTLTVNGLNDTVEVIRDEWGVPHIYASNAHDLFFAQGYVQAQDRWWQMEFFRATGDGRIQELTGQNDSLTSTDIFIRSVGWRRAAENDVTLFDEETTVKLQAFADGVNAYLESRSADQLALEYSLLGFNGVDIEIRPWTVADTAVWQKVMAWDLSGGLVDLNRAQLLEDIGEDLFDDLLPGFAYGEKPTIITEAELPIDESSMSAQGLPAPTQVVKAPTFDVSALAPLNNILGMDDPFNKGIGSNSWAVSGELTDTGKPILANDPHLGIQMPSIWYEIGLFCQPVSEECPYSVRGQTLTPFPGVVIGHNDRIAWGFTNVGPDVIDLYEITVNPDNELQYEYNGEWVDMDVHEETIRFGDSEETIVLQVRETRFGPIINDFAVDDDGNVGSYNNEDPVAMRWTALNPSRTLKAIFLMNSSQNWEDFREAASLFDAPSQNLLYADVDGNIAYQTPGLIPVRPAVNSGLYPLDGSTDEYEWLGFIPFDELPRVLNPEKGYIETANQPVVPLEYYDQLAERLADDFGEDINVVISQDWAQGYRGERIVELIEETDTFTLERMQEIQGDNMNIGARELMPFITALDYSDDTLNDMRDWLGEWDFQMNTDSPQGAFWAYYWVALLENLYADQLQDARSYNADNGNMWSTTLLANDPDNIWWDDVVTADAVEERDDILLIAMQEGYANAVDVLGEDRNEWAWGDLHLANFISNPMGQSGIDIIEDIFNRTDVRVGGGNSIVNATSWSVSSGHFALRALPSFRMIVDLNDMNNSVNIHTTGQSSHPYSPYYANMIPLWSTNQLKPMLFDRDAIVEAAEHTLTLEPSE